MGIEKSRFELIMEELRDEDPAIWQSQREEEIKKLEMALRQAGPGMSKTKSQGRPASLFGKVLFGNPTRQQTLKIETLSIENARLSVEGEIFAVNHREIEKKKLMIVSFDITDYTSSVRVVRALDAAKAAPLVKKLVVGARVLVQGSMIYSSFERDTVINPNSISLLEPQCRRDTAEKKRVELHLHTNMSAMDGISPIYSYAQRAKKWGHPALAVTDHGVAQAFPDAMKAAKQTGIKIIYGLEGYYINDKGGATAVSGTLDTSLDGPFVAFDIETTGLNPKTDAITEIAAVIVDHGEIVDRFQTYVNPCRPIPPEITKLTGITDAAVRNAPKIDEALPLFLSFAGEDKPLAAHNAGFDMSFIRAAMSNAGLSRDFTVIDTLEMSRILLPHLERHRLDAVARELHLKDFRHHSAAEDTAVLSDILLNLTDRLRRQKGVSTLRGVNPALTELKREKGSSAAQEVFHIVLLAKNNTGKLNLYRLISNSNLKHFKRRPIILRDELEKHREGLVIGSACESGELFSAVVKKRPWAELVTIASFYDYLEIQPVANNRFLILNGRARDEEELREFNKTIYKIGKSLNKPVAATGDVHFLDPKDDIFRRIILSGQGFADGDMQTELYYKTTDEMLVEFSYLGENEAREVVVENTNLIADMCDSIKPVPDGQYPPKIHNSAQELENIVGRKAKEIYGQNLPEIVADRLEKELKTIIGQHYDVMYMIAQKLVSKSMEDGYLVGSRGSVGSSVVAYFLGITEVNAYPPHYRCEKCRYCEFHEDDDYGCGPDMPEKNCPVCGTVMEKDGYNIPFATFLGFDGDKTPDIDLNFSGEYQAKAHRQTIEMFGETQVFRAGTIGTIAEKTAFGFVKKYLEERGKTAGRIEIDRLSKGCTNIKRTTGQHPGGLIVVPQGNEINEFCPVQHPADDPKSDIVTTHFDYHSIEENLLKLDLLGHDNPTMIKMLEDLTGIRASEVPVGERQTMAAFTDIGALGIEADKILGSTGAAAIPEYGTKFVRDMLLDTMPSTIDELVRISGLSHGTDVWIGNAQDLVKNGTATLKEIICARDDIMLYLMKKGVAPKTSFKIMENVRKGKGLTTEFEAAMREKNVPDWYIGSCKKIKYMFPKAHAVAYVSMSFKIAWYKVHKPLAFYAAYFSIRADSFDALIMTRGDGIVTAKYEELLKTANERKLTDAEEGMLVTLEVCHEMYKRGFSFLSPDIYASHPNRFVIEDGAVRPPLTSMPGIGQTAAESIDCERGKCEFLSVDELIMRCPKVSKAVVEILDINGALEKLPKTTQLSMF